MQVAQAACVGHVADQRWDRQYSKKQKAEQVIRKRAQGKQQRWIPGRKYRLGCKEKEQQIVQRKIRMTLRLDVRLICGTATKKVVPTLIYIYGHKHIWGHFKREDADQEYKAPNSHECTSRSANMRKTATTLVLYEAVISRVEFDLK